MFNRPSWRRSQSWLALLNVSANSVGGYAVTIPGQQTSAQRSDNSVPTAARLLRCAQEDVLARSIAVVQPFPPKIEPLRRLCAALQDQQQRDPDCWAAATSVEAPAAPQDTAAARHVGLEWGRRGGRRGGAGAHRDAEVSSWCTPNSTERSPDGVPFEALLRAPTIVWATRYSPASPRQVGSTPSPLHGRHSSSGDPRRSPSGVQPSAAGTAAVTTAGVSGHHDF